MKKLTLLLALCATFSLASCAEEKQTTVVHHTHVVHHTAKAQSDSPDNFEAVERPATYSR